MKNNTFSDLSVVKLINDNFIPVMLNGKSKTNLLTIENI